MTRKPVQIAGDHTRLFALCDDGTIWYLSNSMAYRNWIACEPIPQPDDELPEEPPCTS